MLWTREGGIDGKTPVDLDDLDLVAIHPLPSYVWHKDMADFTDLVSDDQASRRRARAINGRGAFRRFKDELHEEYPHLLPAWYAFRDARAARRAVDWLLDASLISHDAADRFRAEHPNRLCPESISHLNGCVREVVGLVALPACRGSGQLEISG